MAAPRFNQAPPPASFRRLSFEAELPAGPVWVEGLIPEGDFYAEEACRLSKKATEDQPFNEPFWSDDFGTMIHFRDKPFSLGPFGHTVREIHDATKGTTDSLLQIQAITTQPPMPLGTEVVYPTRYLIYMPDVDKLSDIKFDQLPENPDPRSLQEAADLAALTGVDETDDKQRLFFYSTLCSAAGERMGGIVNEN